MAKKIKNNRYAFEKLPMSRQTREGVEKGIFIDILSALGDMMMLQDDVYEEQFKNILDGINDIKDVLHDHETRIGCLEMWMKEHKELHEKQIA